MIQLSLYTNIKLDEWVMSTFCIEYFKAKPGCSEKLQQALLSIAEASREEAGCLQYDVLLDQKDPDLFILVLQYVSAEAMDQHESLSYVTDFAENQMQQLCETFYWHEASSV